MSKVYLASPFFTKKEKSIMEAVLFKLRSSGYDVFAPYEFVIPNAWEISNQEWGNQIFKGDVEEIDKADIVVAINHGMYSDSGTAWEVGYAFAKGKQVFNVCFPERTYSLMMRNSCSGTMYYQELISKAKVNLDEYVGQYVCEEQK